MRLLRYNRLVDMRLLRYNRLVDVRLLRYNRLVDMRLRYISVNYNVAILRSECRKILTISEETTLKAHHAELLTWELVTREGVVDGSVRET